MPLGENHSPAHVIGPIFFQKLHQLFFQSVPIMKINWKYSQVRQLYATKQKSHSSIFNLIILCVIAMVSCRIFLLWFCGPKKVPLIQFRYPILIFTSIWHKLLPFLSIHKRPKNINLLPPTPQTMYNFGPHQHYIAGLVKCPFPGLHVAPLDAQK